MSRSRVAHDVAGDTAAIIGLALEWGLYGFSIVMFGATIRTLYANAAFNHTRINRTLVSIALVFFLLSSCHAIVDIVRANEGLVNKRDTFPGGPSAFFTDVTVHSWSIKNGFYLTETIVADAVVIYRCHGVWKSTKIILFPTVLWVSVVVSGAGTLHSFSEGGNTAVFTGAHAKWINTYFGATLATNLISTGLLAYRIWTVNKASSQYRVFNRALPFSSVIRVVIDSGVLYSVALIATLIAYVLKSNMQYIFLDNLMPIMPIAFYMIIIRLSHAQRKNLELQKPTLRSRSQGLSYGPSSEGNTTYPPRPLQIHVSQLSESVKDLSGRRNSSGDHKPGSIMQLAGPDSEFIGGATEIVVHEASTV